MLIIYLNRQLKISVVITLVATQGTHLAFKQWQSYKPPLHSCRYQRLSVYLQEPQPLHVLLS